MHLLSTIRPVRLAFDVGVKGAGRLLDREVLPLLFNGRWIRVPREAWPRSYVNYERYAAKILSERLGPGDTFVDVGAHIGLWSLYAERIVGGSGRVIAFEPSPAFSILAQAAQPSVALEVFNIGIGAAEDTIPLYAQGASTTGSFVREVTEMNVQFQPEVPVSSLAVRVRSLDAVVRELGLRPTLIKVDVEGFELEVIKGAQEVLEEFSCTWLIEVHPGQLELVGGSADEITDVLRSSRYRVDVVDRNPNSLYTILATRERRPGLTRASDVNGRQVAAVGQPPTQVSVVLLDLPRLCCRGGPDGTAVASSLRPSRSVSCWFGHELSTGPASIQPVGSSRR